MQELEYPFNPEEILRKKKGYKKKILNGNKNYIEKNIAILGGSTTKDIIDCLELFLLNQGIKPSFYESNYNKYYEDAVFQNDTLDKFKPEIVYIFTTFRNLSFSPQINDSIDEINQKISNEYNHYFEIWKALKEKYNPIIIQNNFEMPNYRLLGNNDVASEKGLINYIQKLNNKFYEYANKTDNFYILDLNYISADFGLNRWHDEKTYALYKYAMNINAIPYISFNVSNIIKSIFGKNKKSIILDLDNTLWGGIIGEDGIENIKVGPEGEEDEMYLAFQKYIKKQKELGITLNIASKNDEDIALEGLHKSDGVLKKEDFIYINANWEPKDKNINDIKNKLNIGQESLVFIDDNPAEREIVKENINGISVPNVNNVSDFIKTIDRSGYFENTSLSIEDINKNIMYIENAKRQNEEKKYKDYDEYLDALQMNAEIYPFDKQNLPRIVQLINKSNQFNLTTKRYQENEMVNIINNKQYIALYGKLKDKFGDNGLTAIVIGRIDNNDSTVLHIDLFLMSCRILKREMELAMIDEFITKAKNIGIKTIYGYYFKTAKNNMVSNLYNELGFNLNKECIESLDSRIYTYTIPDIYTKQCKHISVNQ